MKIRYRQTHILRIDLHTLFTLIDRWKSSFTRRPNLFKYMHISYFRILAPTKKQVPPVQRMYALEFASVCGV